MALSKLKMNLYQSAATLYAFEIITGGVYNTIMNKIDEMES